MFMKKKLLSVVSLCLSGAMLLSCVGCGEQKQSTNDNGKIQITVSGWPNKDANPASYETMMKIKTDFEAKYPNIEVVPDEWGFDLQTFNAKAEGGTLPTLYSAFLTETKRISENGYAYDVTDLLKEYGYYDKISDFFKDLISYEGKVYHVPGSIYSLGLCMNKDLLEQAGYVDENGNPHIPSTFDELREMSKVIKEKTGKAGLVFPTTQNYGGWIFTLLGWNFGAEFMKQDSDGKWIATFNSDETANAIKYLYDMKWVDNSLPADSLINAEKCTQLLGTGQAAMCIMNAYQVGSLPASYGIDKDSIVFAKMPAGPKGNYTLMGGGTYVIAPNATKEQADAAFKWLDFYGVLPNETDQEAIASRRLNLEERVAKDNEVIGIHAINAWNADSYFDQHGHYLEDEYLNVPESHVASYNDFNGIDYHVEEPVCAQELYSVIDRCLQEALTNKNVNIPQMLDSAAEEFQNNYLNYAE